MIKRHLNAFLKNLGIKQIFWSIIRKQSLTNGINYYRRKTEIYSHSDDIFIIAFCWIDYPNPLPNLTWPQVHRAWVNYIKSHNYFT